MLFSKGRGIDIPYILRFIIESFDQNMGHSGSRYMYTCIYTHALNMFVTRVLFFEHTGPDLKISTVGSSYSLRVRAQIKFVQSLFLLSVPQDICDLSTPSINFPQEGLSRCFSPAGVTSGSRPRSSKSL